MEWLILLSRYVGGGIWEAILPDLDQIIELRFLYMAYYICYRLFCCDVIKSQAIKMYEEDQHSSPKRYAMIKDWTDIYKPELHTFWIEVGGPGFKNIIGDHSAWVHLMVGVAAMCGQPLSES